MHLTADIRCERARFRFAPGSVVPGSLVVARTQTFGDVERGRRPDRGGIKLIGAPDAFLVIDCQIALTVSGDCHQPRNGARGGTRARLRVPR
ncbi:protein of unknown function [Methylocella tundrae]|uniref:Uncharacterized protein n=1 Tax=Methylocella tundrae TaxID=227605 RepID=A0A4U8Z5T1_METTU|nr:protein of unknown function [Methylocella tundrae]